MRRPLSTQFRSFVFGLANVCVSQERPLASRKVALIPAIQTVNGEIKQPSIGFSKKSVQRQRQQ